MAVGGRRRGGKRRGRANNEEVGSVSLVFVFGCLRERQGGGKRRKKEVFCLVVGVFLMSFLGWFGFWPKKTGSVLGVLLWFRVLGGKHGKTKVLVGISGGFGCAW